MRVLYIFIITFLLIGSAFAQDTIKLVYFEDFAPYSWKENDQMKGILIDVVNDTIQSKMGIPVIHEGYPWKRAQMMVKRNIADAFITVPTPQRKEYTEISSTPVATITMTIFTNRKNRNIQEIEKVKTISDIKKFNSVSYIGNGWSEKNLRGMDVYWVPTLEKALFLIAENRYDVYVGGSKSVWYNIKKLGYERQLVRLPMIIDTTTLNLCIGKESIFAHIMSDFDVAMENLQKTGRLQEIYDKY